MIRAALFAARCRRVSQWGEEPWRERPRCARSSGPRVSGGVAHAMAASVAVSCRTACSRLNAALFAASNVLIVTTFSGRSGPVRPGKSARKKVAFRA